ncbi:ParB/RepB/Spo0J family partition protein [Arenicella xantha]|uniref:Probable chromosome-partitioning protein ParB n=1 Tax=Arenicella xantha TaxID=644221 RepID=A0A395JTA0_9GAMM|nr:ParB/RepB/Spo0J family partition protein [Arenicella xantha]RBP53775.1 chromosome segregation DNA-binding protein [Arenicella xantha]
MTSKKRKRLGRGLEALLGNTEPSTDGEVSRASITSAPNNLPIEKLQPGQYQPRTRMDQESLEELASSIKSQGIIQPILVRPVAGDKYEIIAGERRWRAAQIAQLDEVPVLVRNIPDEATLAVALIENIQRENLNPVEEAVGLKRLMDEFELTHEEMAKSVGRSRAAVTNLLRLLSLSHGAKQLLEHGKIEMGHARALLGLPIEQQDFAAAEVYSKRLSVRQTEALVRAYANPKKKTSKPSKSADVRGLEEQLGETLGTRVSLEDKNGKGKLIIEYKNLDVLDGILAHIK